MNGWSLLGIAVGVVASSPAHAGASGWVWNNCLSASCTPSTTYAYNSSGGTNATTRLSTGSYQVRFPGLARGGGNAQVTAYATSGHCQIESWYSLGADQLVNVGCYDAAGARADSYFDLMFYDHGAWLATNPNQESAYAWADQPSAAAPYIPSRTYAYNSTGGKIQITRLGAGQYAVFTARMNTRGVVALVSAYGTTPRYCAARDSVPSGSGLLTYVDCTDMSGVLTDSLFSFSVASRTPPAGADVASPFRGGGIEIDGIYGTVRLNESFLRTVGFTDADVVVTPLGSGSYEVTLPGVDDLFDTFLVNASSTFFGDHCNVAYWFADSLAGAPATTVGIDCYDAFGAQFDMDFTLLWQTSTL